MKPSKDKIAMILALALFESEKKVNIRQQHLKLLQKVSNLIEEAPQFKTFLISPMFSVEEKEKMLREIHTSKSIRLFLKLVMRSGMISYLNIITTYYEKLFLDSTEKIKTKIIVARSFDISKSIKDAFLKKLETITNKNIELEFRVDPAILGGFLLETSNLYVDASLKKALEDIKNSL